jgi:hypothetical protein
MKAPCFGSCGGEGEVVSLDELLTIGAVGDDHQACSHLGGRHRRQPNRVDRLRLIDWVLGDRLRVPRVSLFLALLLGLAVVLAILVGVVPALSVAGLYVLLRVVVRRQVWRGQAVA